MKDQMEVMFGAVVSFCLATEQQMIELGYEKVACSFTIDSGSKCRFQIEYKSFNDSGLFNTEYEFIRGDSYGEAITAVRNWLRKLKPANDAQKAKAIQELGRAIDKCRDAGVEDVFINPLSEVMQKLSKNILTKEEVDDTDSEIPF